jgi:transposase InsO family protein
VKSLEAAAPPGLALLGNQLCFDDSLLASAEVIVSAMDADRGGNSAVLDLKATYLDKDVRIYELEGHKDPNEFLQAVRSGRSRKLSPERKLQLYREFQSTANKAELARRWGIDRSYLYEVVRDCEETLVESLSSRRRGRPPKGVPTTLDKALERIKELEAQYEGEATAREEFYCRSELLALRLKWAELEAAELRGEPVDDKEGPKKKPHIKKKEKQETLKKVEELCKRCSRQSRSQLMSYTGFSASQLYKWQQGEQLDKKERAAKVIAEETVENAAKVVGTFPHLAGRKGQAYMLYHQLGYLGMKAYDRIKRQVGRLVGQEVARRKLLSPREGYEHVRPQGPGEIWAQDFTELCVEGCCFKFAVVLDVFDQFFLGYAVASRASTALVGRPVERALEVNGGKGPERFLLSDNGCQYISSEHGRLLSSAEIVQRRIPACVPQYNGSAECSMVDVKSVFYNVWERREREQADEGKSLLERVEAAAEETIVLLNEGIPRPSLGGVTPADVHFGRKEMRQAKDPAVSRERKVQVERTALDAEVLGCPEVGAGAGPDDGQRSAVEAGFLLPQAPTQDRTTEPEMCRVISWLFSPIYLAPGHVAFEAFVCLELVLVFVFGAMTVRRPGFVVDRPR